jgi:hypothetical protein
MSGRQFVFTQSAKRVASEMLLFDTYPLYVASRKCNLPFGPSFVAMKGTLPREGKWVKEIVSEEVLRWLGTPAKRVHLFAEAQL